LKNTALITTKNLTLGFKSGNHIVTAIQKNSITIPENKITIIFGASGSGKSSLLNIISGLQAPTTGKIYYKNTDLYKKDQNELAFFRARELGIVYQTNYWVKSLTVLENVSIPLYFMGERTASAHKKALVALERVKMAAYANTYPILLSGGEQQRIAMARAIVGDPQVIIADEPTGNLDSSNGDMIISLLQELHGSQNKTVILVTHNMEYLAIADHLLELHDGVVDEISELAIPQTVNKMLMDTQSRITFLLKKDTAV
jgi:putative ABC transport system ATP-binding protein